MKYVVAILAGLSICFGAIASEAKKDDKKADAKADAKKEAKK